MSRAADTELAMAKSGSAQANASVIVNLDLDEDSLRARFIPEDGDNLSEDEFIQRGVDLVQFARTSFRLLGELIDWKFRREGADTDATKREIVLRYAPEWGVSTSTIWKAWVLACRWPSLPRPEDAPPTLTYEILSGCATEAEAERVLDLALAEGWRVSEAREIKALVAKGALDNWQRVRLTSNGRTVYATDGERQVPVATLLDNGDGLAQAGAALLRMRARV